MRKTYRLSCHCGRLQCEADADLMQGTGRCNCTICAKKRGWGVTIRPEDFRLLSEESDIGDYQFGTMSGHHRFCKTCGIHVYGHGYVEEIGGHFVSLSVASIDNITPEELAELPIHYSDGRHDNWMNPPRVTSYL